MKHLSTVLLLASLTAGLSSPAAARDVRHRWCPEEAPLVQPAPQPQVERINLAADALFRFNRSAAADMLPEGHATLDRLAHDLISRQARIDSIALIGHTDRLGLERAQTVKAYLQSQGVQDPISVSSAGESQPVSSGCEGNRATAELKACLQPDRRVTVEITGTAAQ